MEWRRDAGAYFPSLDRGATSVPGLYAAGEAAGVLDREAAAASGEVAANSALGGAPEAGAAALPVDDRGPNELEGYYRELLHAPRGGGKWVLCPCEDVLLHEVEAASAAGFRGIEVIKRMTGVGTGLCQGRYCLPDALLVLALLEARAPSEVGYITQRPPVLPTTLDTLASLPEDPVPAPEAV